MRLRTELYPNRLGSMTFGFDDESLRHDAYAAHALVMAQDEFWKMEGLEIMDARDAVERIGRRADQLMKDWGYTGASNE